MMFLLQAQLTSRLAEMGRELEQSRLSAHQQETRSKELEERADQEHAMYLENYRALQVINIIIIPWASKETYHFFRVTLTKIHLIKMNHIWTQISFSFPHEAHLKNQRVAFVKKEKNVVKLLFFKHHRNCSLRTSTKGRLFRTFNSYSFNFKGGLCDRRTGYCPCWASCPGGEQFLWYLKNYLLRFHLILLSFYSIKRLIFEMCLVRSTIANLECRSEEVINFFWHSV